MGNGNRDGLLRVHCVKFFQYITQRKALMKGPLFLCGFLVALHCFPDRTREKNISLYY